MLKRQVECRCAALFQFTVEPVNGDMRVIQGHIGFRCISSGMYNPVGELIKHERKLGSLYIKGLEYAVDAVECHGPCKVRQLHGQPGAHRLPEELHAAAVSTWLQDCMMHV